VRLRVQSACLACLVLLLAFPLPADAVRVVAALGLDATPILSASGDYVVVSTTQRIRMMVTG